MSSSLFDTDSNVHIEPNSELGADAWHKGFEELSGIYPSFKLSPKAQSVWAKRLRKAGVLNKGWLKAVHWAIEAGLEKSPSFFLLKKKALAYSKSEAQRRDGLPICEPSGWAVMSDQKMEVSAAFMKELRIYMKDKTIKDPEYRKHLVSTWHSAYRALPNYYPEKAIKALIDTKNRTRLDVLGFTDPDRQYANLPDR